MLESIVINNFTIIDYSEIEFNEGMTALTGETGAGKSILLDAIKLVLGDRADSDSVKSGCDKADISVCFNISALPGALDWLQQNELENGDECLLRRVIQANGRSKAFINGSPAPASHLRHLGEMLVDIHGQHDHQSLQKSAIQQQLLDASLPDPLLLQQVEAAYAGWKRLDNQLKSARDHSAQKQHRIDLLKLYTQELRSLALEDGELIRLQDEYNRLSHAGQILETTTGVLGRLYDNDEFNVQTELARCAQDLEELTRIDSTLSGSSGLIRDAVIQIQEVSSDLRAYHDGIDVDPARMDWLNQRLSQAQDLARKHQVAAEGLVDLLRDLEQELDQLQISEQDQEKLQHEMETLKQEYLDKANRLSAVRANTAQALSAQITGVMQTLGMQGGQFDISVDADSRPQAFTASGIDQVKFHVSANPGQPLKPLHKVASGGELSRISLAMQVILSESSQIPTLIFDEVDSGIGGGIAEIVGRKLRQIAGSRQVFCVTHLPQVASQAHHHYQVSKIKSNDATSTDVSVLDNQQRLDEIARMLGGMTITEQTRAHAQEMINNVA